MQIFIGEECLLKSIIIFKTHPLPRSLFFFFFFISYIVSILHTTGNGPFGIKMHQFTYPERRRPADRLRNGDWLSRMVYDSRGSLPLCVNPCFFFFLGGFFFFLPGGSEVCIPASRALGWNNGTSGESRFWAQDPRAALRDAMRCVHFSRKKKKNRLSTRRYHEMMRTSFQKNA